MNTMNAMKGKAHGAQQPKHIDQVDDRLRAAQRSRSFMQSQSALTE